MAAESPGRLVDRVGRRIGELRRNARLSQEKFAERLDVSVQYVSRVESGENLTLHSLAAIAKALGVEVNALFEAPRPEMRASKRGRGRPRKG